MANFPQLDPCIIVSVLAAKQHRGKIERTITHSTSKKYAAVTENVLLHPETIDNVAILKMGECRESILIQKNHTYQAFNDTCNKAQHT